MNKYISTYNNGDFITYSNIVFIDKNVFIISKKILKI